MTHIVATHCSHSLFTLIVATRPATGLPTGALPEKEIHFGQGRYTRTPVSRTFFRNYGVVHVRPPLGPLFGNRYMCSRVHSRLRVFTLAIHVPVYAKHDDISDILFDLNLFISIS